VSDMMAVWKEMAFLAQRDFQKPNYKDALKSTKHKFVLGVQHMLGTSDHEAAERDVVRSTWMKLPGACKIEDA